MATRGLSFGPRFVSTGSPLVGQISGCSDRGLKSAYLRISEAVDWRNRYSLLMGASFRLRGPAGAATRPACATTAGGTRGDPEPAGRGAIILPTCRSTPLAKHRGDPGRAP